MNFEDDKGKSRKVKLVAHRGANGVAPENTMAAFTACRKWNIDYVEIDVRSSIDGILYNHHDTRLGRTSDGKGYFKLRSSSYIDRLDAGSWFSKDFACEKIPRLEDILKAADDHAKFFFDVKFCNVKQLLSLIHKYNMDNRCFFWFKYEFMLRSFRRLAPYMALKMNCNKMEDLQKLHKRYKPEIIECDYENFSPEMIAQCRALGMELMINFGNKGLDTFSKTLALGADRIVLDYPIKYIRGNK